jgi:hydroxymethylpyrimidine/phosphomethylpyrimidine kinase
LLITYNKDIKIIWDPIISASAGYDFHKKISIEHLQHIMGSIEMITPNWEEIISLSGKEDALLGAELISKDCNVYLKGGHNMNNPGTDRIWLNKKPYILKPEKITSFSKHGTGCVLSAAITAYLALGNTELNACKQAKKYTYKFMTSNSSNLGQHQLPGKK